MANTPPSASCPGCGTVLSPDARFCPACGAAQAAGETLEFPDEAIIADPAVAVSATETPPTVHRIHRRPLGIHPVPLLGALGTVALVVAIVLLAAGSLVGGLILLGLALALLTLFRAGVKSEPDAPTARLTLRTVDRCRSLARLAAVTIRASARAGLQLLQIRRRRRRLRSDLQHRLKPLGEAVHENDEHRVQVLKQQAAELDERLDETEREASAAISAALTEIKLERATSQPTQALAPSAEEAENPPRPDQTATSARRASSTSPSATTKR